MKKFIIQVILLLIVVGVGLYLFKSNPDLTGLPFVPEKTVFKEVEINSVKLQIEVADTQVKRSKGLGGRDSLPINEGMLFVFPNPGQYPFWMKGLSFPLDFIWIRGDMVVDLTQNVQPSSPGQADSSLQIYQSKEQVNKILEVNAGTIQRLDIKVGNTVKIQE